MDLRLADPWYLLLLALVPLAFIWRPRPPTIGFSDVRLFAVGARPSLRLRLRWLPELLHLSGLVLLIVALARPQTPDPTAALYRGSRAIELVIDTSGSMATVERLEGGGPQTRLDQVKTFIHDFLIATGGTFRRPDDRIGVVKLARYADAVCPLTTDHASVLDSVRSLTVNRLENRTNLGDGLALALAALRRAPAEDRLIVLCSDGAHNVPEALSPAEGTRIAQALGVPIYVVGVGSVATAANRLGAERDEQALQHIAQLGSGRYYRAENRAAIGEIVADLDRLAPSAVRIEGYWRWRDRFADLLLLALAVWLVEALLRATWLKISPSG